MSWTISDPRTSHYLRLPRTIYDNLALPPYITQIGRSMDDMEITAIDENFRESISRCKNTDDNRAALDRGFFCPHYPYLPPGRRYAIGMQFAGKITTFVHSTHFRSSEFR
eukprot:scaffold138531_cov118-Phaeocystis_antarctica.AAC.2